MKDNENPNHNTDMAGVGPALLRAAHRAREIARQTGTRLVIVRDGVLLELDPDDPSLDDDVTPTIETIHDR
ncbi:MAG: hypothetical protein QOK37_1684 [Thermoanaerobaculia bacterium]|jgi:hypothetical protein|nr:hypothetical protein [Thermoanaerobaculia bacterium]